MLTVKARFSLFGNVSANGGVLRSAAVKRKSFPQAMGCVSNDKYHTHRDAVYSLCAFCIRVWLDRKYRR